MTIEIFTDSLHDHRNAPVPIEFIRFSGGEEHARIDTSNMTNCKCNVNLYATLTDAGWIMRLLLVNEALRNLPNVEKVNLICPYFPYARQDRRTRVGESLSVKVMAQLINNCHFDKVTVWDAHSDVTTALLDNVTNVRQLEAFFWCLIELEAKQPEWLRGIRGRNSGSWAVVSPDAGALKKAYEVASYLKTPMLLASKHRDPTTGELSDTTVNLPAAFDKATNLVIIDDICDGGRTFIELSKVLRSGGCTGKIHLHVTHGIFSNGLNNLFDYFTSISCAKLHNKGLSIPPDAKFYFYQ